MPSPASGGLIGCQGMAQRLRVEAHAAPSWSTGVTGSTCGRGVLPNAGWTSPEEPQDEAVSGPLIPAAYFCGSPGILRPLGLAGMPVRSATVPRRSTCGGAYGGAYGGAPAPPSEEAEAPSVGAVLSPEASAGDEDAEGERDEDEGDEDEEDMGVFIGKRKRDCEERVRKEISAHAVSARW